MHKLSDEIKLDVFTLFDEQFSISDFKKSFIKSEIASSEVLSETKDSIKKALYNDEIDKNVKYVVDMNDDILESIERENLKFVTGKDGELYAQLRDSNGRFGSKLPIKRELEEKEISIEALQMAIQIKAIEYQLNQILSILADLEGKIADVLVGQKNNRIGLFYSGLSLFIESKQIENEALKYQIVAQALKSLNDSNYQMIQEIRTSIEYLVTKQYEKEKKIMDKIREKISIIYQCYEVVHRTAFIKAAIYQENGEISAMLTAIDEYGRFIEKMIIPYAGKLTELDRNNNLIETGTWGKIGKTLERCKELKKMITEQSVYQIGKEEKKHDKR